MRVLVLTMMLIVLVAAAATLYLQWEKREPQPSEPAPADGPPTAQAPAGPRYPIPVPSTQDGTTTPPPSLVQTPGGTPSSPPESSVEPLPALNTSNTVVTQLLSGIFGEQTLSALFSSDEFIRRFVITVDNLPNPKLPRQNLLFKRVAGPFQVNGAGDELSISPDNAARYVPYVDLAMRVETRRLVSLYVRLYPLFQEAYAEISTPNAYFNDRLVEVIDHLLETPVVEEPLRITQPKVLYQYADPALERLSAGQKALLRMGAANAMQIKAKLSELRAALTGAAWESTRHAAPPAVSAE